MSKLNVIFPEEGERGQGKGSEQFIEFWLQPTFLGLPCLAHAADMRCSLSHGALHYTWCGTSYTRCRINNYHSTSVSNENMIWNRQFRFDANNYIISLQKYIAFQYSTGCYQECIMSMSMVMIIFRLVLEIAENQNIFLFWPIWIGRIEIPETWEGISTLLIR
jgi:hypothetical protein